MEFVIDVYREEILDACFFWMVDSDIKKTLSKNPHYNHESRKKWDHYFNLKENLKEGTKVIFDNEIYTFRNWDEKGFQYKPCVYIQLQEKYDKNPKHAIEISKIEIYDENIHKNYELQQDEKNNFYC